MADGGPPAPERVEATGASFAIDDRVSPEPGDIPADDFDGVRASVLREMLARPELHIYATTGSALDIAHRIAAGGAPHGSLVLADAQTRGRGRGGKHWVSPAGTGIWLALVARPSRADVIRVLTVRLGLAAAVALEPFTVAPVRLKWPNDLYVRSGKLAGVLVEARWRGETAEWLAVGVGVNVVAPIVAAGGVAGSAVVAASLRPGMRRVDALTALVPALVAALSRDEDLLDDMEMRAFAARDLAAGRRATAPANGTVVGINRRAELLVKTTHADVALGSGSLVLSEES